jgi:hypothetical protein
MRTILAILILALWTLSSHAAVPPTDAVWNSDRSAAAAAFPGTTGTRVVAYLRRDDGAFTEVDLSPVERKNFGRLGRKPADYERYETKPIAWLSREDDFLQVTVQTRAWRGGQRYTALEHVLLRADGAVLWR